MKAVVLAGGSGKGLRVVTGGKPKVLMNICGRPFLERVLRNLKKSGVREVVIVTDKPAEFEDLTTRLGREMTFEVRPQQSPEVVGAMLSASEELSRNALLIYGDTMVEPEAYLLTASLGMDSGDPVFLVVPNEDIRLYGAVSVDPEGRVVSFVEKPEREVEGAYAFGGIAVLNFELMDLIRSEKSLQEAVNKYVNGGGSIRTVLWSGVWVDLGYPINALEAMYYIMKGFSGTYISSKAEVSRTAVIEGPVFIDDGAVVEHYAVIKGPAYIGKDVMVGTHTFVRPYTDIEADATLGSYSEVVWSLISEGASVGRSSFLGYSIVGEGAIVEPGVLTKLLVPPGEEGIKAIKIVKKRRMYRKAGAVIPAKH
ncbi:MAG: NTP transferase domain-containing protein, partial [Desulfurococcales archaeon]|nr:NTP transferase domain-containing protein [Desulfurococcales archaeon]